MKYLGSIDLNFINIITQSSLVFFSISSNYFLGRLFVSGCFYLRCLTGICINALVITILMSNWAGLSKYCGLILSFAPLLFYLYKNYTILIKTKKNIYINFAKNIIAWYIFYIALVGLYICSISTELNTYNGHQNYFSGISLEALRADYYSRLKIFDNYPVVWSRYHFFNGAITTIPQLLLEKTNILTFWLAKCGVISIFISALISLNLRSKINLQLIFSILISIVYLYTMLPRQMSWSLFTNAYSSAILLLISFTFLRLKNYKYAILFILIFTNSTSRSFVPGCVIAITILLLNVRTDLGVFLNKKIIFNQTNLPFFIFLIIILLSSFSMLFSGETTNSPISISVKNYFHLGWLNLMSPGITPDYLALKTKASFTYRPDFLWFSTWNIVMAAIYIVDKNNISFNKYVVYNYIAILAAIFFFLYVCVNLVINGNNILERLIYYSLISFFYYLLPIILVFMLAPKSISPYLIVFIGASLAQILILDPSISLPNYVIIEFIVFYLMIINISGKKLQNSTIIASVIGLFCIITLRGLPLPVLDIFSMNKLDPTTHMNNSVVDFWSINDGIFCFNGSDEDSEKASALGARVTFSDIKRHDFSMSIVFAKPSANDIIDINFICKDRK
jgi:hypothetical protein